MIHTSRLLGNVAVLRGLCPPGVQVCAAVKADAYGHGARLVARRLREADVELLAVATVEEALELRESGDTGDLVLYGALQDDEWQAAVELDLQLLLSSARQLDLLASAAQSAGKRVQVHLKVDTGMGRLGCQPDEAVDLAHALVHRLPLEFVGLCTHFASSEAEGLVSVERQLALFDQVRRELATRGLHPRWLHAANSGGILGHPGSVFNLIRPGISLYGYPPSAERPVAGLRPVLELVSRVAHVKTVPAGTALSYGSRYVTPQRTDVATVPIGYADGYRRSFTNRAPVVVAGRRFQVSGTVCMDQFVVDVGPDSGVKVGDEVLLLGEQRAGASPPDADELAALAGTISYELLCGLARRVPRLEVS